LLFNLKDDPNELVNLIDDKSAGQVQRELKEILNNLLNTEEVSLRAFKTQESILTSWLKKLSEDKLFEKFKGRLGDGQARSMAKLAKSKF